MSFESRPLQSRWRRSLIIMGVLMAGLVMSIRAATAAGRPEAIPAARLTSGIEAGDALRPSSVLTFYTYLAFSSKAKPCGTTGASYAALGIPDWQPSPPAESHGDLNLALRGYVFNPDALLGLVDIGGGTDPNAPQLAGLFASPHAPSFQAAYRVHNWDWDCNCRGAPIDDVDVSLADLAAAPGDTIHVPDSGYGIGGGYETLVLYASAERLTLKYTLEDNVAYGYTLHLENICVDPDLVALYQGLNSAGRHALPALRAGQAVGQVRDDGRVGVAIRDTGAFMDTRSRQDWWRSY